MSVSIVIPYYNRKKFEKLIEYNIKSQTYPNIKEVIIADDSDKPNQTLKFDIPYALHYHKVKRMSIGAKRNFLKKQATGEYICHMDTDDAYNPFYIQNCMDTIVNKSCEVTGSSDMLFYNNATNWTGKQSCLYINMLNEATMMYSKKYADDHHYADRSHSENETFTNEYWKIRETPIENIMVCFNHSNNTVDKSIWEKDQFKGPLPKWFWKGQYFKIYKEIMKLSD
jgi:glycosyltransferase involved in cell wall biosynthesis